MSEDDLVRQWCICPVEWCLCDESTMMTMEDALAAQVRSGELGVTWTCPSCAAGNWVMSMGALPQPQQGTRPN